MSVTPYVVGQWVRGEKFYGRSGLIDEILHGNRNWMWLLGTRRIGKTSLLKQVEHLTSHAPELGYFPLFWDFQGCDSPDELHLGFSDSLFDAEERLDELRIPLGDVEAGSLFTCLSRLRRKLRSKGKKLLLLCDEVEELIKLHQAEPSLLRKLRRAMQSQEDIRSVLASTIRLWDLAEEIGDTSPFLHGFSPPLYIHNLDDDEARALIRQANLPSQSQPHFDEQLVEMIRSHCDNHPYLVQLLCKRYVELDNLDDAVEQVTTDPMVGFFFTVDFQMLSETERDVLRIIGEHDSSTSNSIQESLMTDSAQLGGSLHRLQHLGYIRRTRDRGFVLANYFFRNWFRDLPHDDTSKTRPLTQTAADSTLTVDGEVIDGRYRLSSRVGKGATGSVYKAEDTVLRVDIAVKVLRPEYAANDEALERLRREIILSRDISHPNVVNVYHLGNFDGKRYITMQWIDGSTLAHVVRRDGPLLPSRAVRIATRLAGALKAAHDCHVLHRDIKAQNILIDQRDEPFLTDFGLARLAHGPGMTRDGIFLGTPDYASPEQASGHGADQRSDIYSLGIVLFEMVTGRRPFRASSSREVLEMQRDVAPPNPRDIAPGLPGDLSNLILLCLEKPPRKRFQSAGELLRGLKDLAPT